MITSNSDHIKVEKHIGTWYVVSEGFYVEENTTEAKHLFLLEHETYGDETACVIVDETGKLIMDEVWNGFGDLEEADWTKTTERSISR